MSICCAAAGGVDEEAAEHLRAALAMEELTYEELQELVVHYAVYLGLDLRPPSRRPARHGRPRRRHRDVVSADRTTRVGFVGLGSQGGPMARRIVDAGFPTTLWARRAASLEPFGDTAASVAATPAELGAASDVLGVCVVDDAGVDEVLRGPEGALGGDGRRLRRHRAQHGPPGRPACGCRRTTRASTSSMRRSAAGATRPPPESCW